MATAAKAYNIIDIMRHLRRKKLSDGNDMVDIKLPLRSLSTDLTSTLSSLSSHSLDGPPLPVILRFHSALPIRVSFAVDMLRNPQSPTPLITKVAPSIAYKRGRSLKFLAAIITLKQLALSLFPNFKVIKDMQIYSSLSAVNMLGYLLRSHGGIVSDYKVFFFFGPFSTLHNLMITHLLKKLQKASPDSAGSKFLADDLSTALS